MRSEHLKPAAKPFVRVRVLISSLRISAILCDSAVKETVKHINRRVAEVRREDPDTTLGEQRSIAVQDAAIWSARLDSNVPIRIRAQS